MSLIQRLHWVTGALWLAVVSLIVVQVIGRSMPWDASRLYGMAALVSFIVLYGVSALDAVRRAVRWWQAIVAAEALAVLGAYLLMPRDPIPALLTVFVAQVSFHYPGRRAAVPLVLVNIALFAVCLVHVSAWLALAPMLLYGSLQFFANVVVTAQVRGEEARTEALAAHGARVAMQALLEETVRDRERLRIARDLHDVMGHKLTALQINVQVLQRQSPLVDAPELDRVASLAQELLADTRAIVAQSQGAQGIAMTEALGALALAFPESLVSVQVESDLRIEEGALAQLVLRVAQEGITNALRHGRARRVEVTLQRAGEWLELRLLDDGRGLRGEPAGFGLTQLAARVRDRGGELTARDLPAGGVELLARLPARSHGPAQDE